MRALTLPWSPPTARLATLHHLILNLVEPPIQATRKPRQTATSRNLLRDGYLFDVWGPQPRPSLASTSAQLHCENAWPAHRTGQACPRTKAQQDVASSKWRRANMATNYSSQNESQPICQWIQLDRCPDYRIGPTAKDWTVTTVRHTHISVQK